MNPRLLLALPSLVWNKVSPGDALSLLDPNDPKTAVQEVRKLIELLSLYFSCESPVADVEFFKEWLKSKGQKESVVAMFDQLLAIEASDALADEVRRLVAADQKKKAIHRIQEITLDEGLPQEELFTKILEVATPHTITETTCVRDNSSTLDFSDEEEADDSSDGREFKTPLITGPGGEHLVGYGGDLWSIIGGAKDGKSTMLVWLAAESVKMGLNVLYLDFENGTRIMKADVGSALACQAYPRGGSIPKIIHKNSVRLQRENPDWGRLRVRSLMPGDPFAISAIAAEIEGFNKKFGHPPDILIVDYLDKEKVSDREERKQASDDVAYEVALISATIGFLRKYDMLGITGFQSNRKAKDEAIEAKKKGRESIRSTANVSGAYSKIRLCAINFILERAMVNGKPGAILYPHESRYAILSDAPQFEFVNSWDRGFFKAVGSLHIPNEAEVSSTVEAQVADICAVLEGKPATTAAGKLIQPLTKEHDPLPQGTMVAPKAAFEAALNGNLRILATLALKNVFMKFRDGVSPNGNPRYRNYTNQRKFDGVKDRWFVFTKPSEWTKGA